MPLQSLLPRLLLILALLKAGSPAAALPQAANPPAELTVYAESLAEGWLDWSWSISSNLANPSPAHGGSKAILVSFTTAWDGFKLARLKAIDLSGYTALHFWLHGGSRGGQSILVTLTGGQTNCMSASQSVNAPANQWVEVEIPLADLGSPAEISAIQFFNSTDSSQEPFYLDDISFVSGTQPPSIPTLEGPELSIDANADRYAISPLIYGMNFADEKLATELRLPLNRWGGNATTRYNWKNDTSNRAMDWYFENIPNDNAHPELLPDGSAANQFIEKNKRIGAETIMTMPLIGWTPKSRDYACGFSVKKYGSQDSVDPYRSDCGSGTRDKNNLSGSDPTDTSTPITPADVKEWIAYLISRYGSASQGGVAFYNLDNEPMLWNITQRDIHPAPVSYDEIKTRTIAYAAAIKTADPGAQTLGPVLWGWSAYFYSALDLAAGGHWWNTRPDRKAHNDIPFLPWYLQQMHAYEDQFGVRLLDYVDVHFYPQGKDVFSNAAGTETAALRLRSTRALWDPLYIDESWINDAIYLIPRLRQWVRENYPGTKTALTEYNFGSLCSVNGALTQADVLGIFGREQLDLATLWDPPKSAQPGAFAFRMFRNYDGEGRAFGQTSVLAATTDSEQLAAYAALRAEDGALTVMVINKTASNLTVPVRLSHFPALGSALVYTYSAAQTDRILAQPSLPIQSGSFKATFAANSITLWVIPLNQPIQPDQHAEMR